MVISIVDPPEFYVDRERAREGESHSYCQGQPDQAAPGPDTDPPSGHNRDTGSGDDGTEGTARQGESPSGDPSLLGADPPSDRTESLKQAGHSGDWTGGEAIEVQSAPDENSAESAVARPRKSTSPPEVFTLPPERAAELEVHPLAETFPPVVGEQLEGIKADIKAHGQREPATLFQGKILDGRTRRDAGVRVGAEFRYVEWDGIGNPLDFVLSKNSQRRHLSTSQRACVAAKLVVARRRARERNAVCTGDSVSGVTPPKLGKSRDQAAKALNVSSGLVHSALTVLEKGIPELLRFVETDRVSVSAAAEVAGLDHEAQAKVVAGGPDKVAAEAKRLGKQGVKAGEPVSHGAANGDEHRRSDGETSRSTSGSRGSPSNPADDVSPEPVQSVGGTGGLNDRSKEPSESIVDQSEVVESETGGDGSARHVLPPDPSLSREVAVDGAGGQDVRCPGGPSGPGTANAASGEARPVLTLLESLVDDWGLEDRFEAILRQLYVEDCPRWSTMSATTSRENVAAGELIRALKDAVAQVLEPAASR